MDDSTACPLSRMPKVMTAIFMPFQISIRVTALLLCFLSGLMTDMIAADDAYIAGYAAAVLQHEFAVAKAALFVQEGVVTVNAESLGAADRTKIQTALESIPGVIRVQIREGPDAVQDSAAPSSRAIKQELPKPESKFLPRGLLFAPLHADPRWPQFSIAYRRISVGDEPKKTGSANFGETFALYRNAAPLDGQWEIAFQGGLFSVFNMSTSSLDLVNADYTAGLSLAIEPAHSPASFASIIKARTWGTSSFSIAEPRSTESI